MNYGRGPEDVGDVFHLKKPKHLGSGLISGLKNIGRGVAGGMALVVAAPVVGFKQGGVGGFAAGLGLGVVGGVAAMASGVGVGMYQVGRGAMNTPAAIKGDMAGKAWNPFSREWEMYDLQAEAAAVLAVSDQEFLKREKAEKEEKEKEKARRKGSKDGESEPPPGEAPANSSANNPETEEKTDPKAYGVKETELYDVLGIKPDATAAQIKKAYYKKAQQFHPDKNPDDPEANAKFQKVGEAYQILSDDHLRAAYDRDGRGGVEEAPQMDSAALYAMIFGSEHFERYLGELQLATMMQGGDDDDVPSSLLKFKQQKREVKCAVYLADKLQPFVTGELTEEQFKAQVVAEAKEVAGSPFGATLLYAIGYIYEEQAEIRLAASQGGSYLRRYKSKGHDVQTQYAFFKAVGRTAVLATKAEKGPKAKEKEKLTDDNAPKESTEAGQAGVSSSGPPAGEGGATPSAQPKVATEEKEKEKDKEKEKGKGKDKAELPNLDNLSPEQQKELAGLMLEMMWRTTVLDIESTLRHVCWRVCEERVVPKDVRARRAKALLVLGRAFMEVCAADAKGGLSHFQQTMAAHLNMPGSSAPEEPAE